MEDLLRNYLRDREIDIPSLRVALERIRPARLLWLLLSIRIDSYTAVMIAAEAGHTEACRLLISPLIGTADELLWMKKMDDEATALHIAARRGHSKIVEIQLDTVSAEKYEFVAQKNEKGDTALLLAAGWGGKKCVESLLNNFSLVQRDSLLKIQDNILHTALHMAATRGETTALKVMLGFMISVTASSFLNMKDAFNCTPLEKAEYKGRKETLELMKRWQKGPIGEALAFANEKICDLQMADKQKAKASGHSDIVDILLHTVTAEKKYEFAAEKNQDGATAISVATLYGGSKFIESLLNIFLLH
ncbi:serine/threonine-protein phosphatase 6 regulatory ankyrin repeat subunit B-like [Watersipora subatra]|uniref:serine/threonine-protein phosphatase 6 regulatory ankyrin repeat subunit B-like n=1 Tax=Watersipora subatra TaxID=2589382 RepID=UPI00355C6125